MRIIVSVLILLMCSACTDRRSGWDEITATGELRFVTIESPATYYKSNTGPKGLEFDLAQRFADEIGVKLKTLIVPSARDVIDAIKYGKAVIGGAALMSNTQLGGLRFGPAYLHAPQQLVYRRSEARPGSLQDVAAGAINISSVQLQQIKDKYPHFVWTATYDKDAGKLLKMVQQENIHSAIATKNMVNIYRHIYPDIKVAFDVTAPQPLAWVYNRNDTKLHEAVTAFLEKMRVSGELEDLVYYYYGHIQDFNYVNVRTFLERIDSRLPAFEELFKQTAAKYDMDWTLLAAMSYQESHWRADAVSPTGVRGLMMLTQTTAEQMDIADRIDPKQSIDGGARYLGTLMEMIPERIEYPDRLWFALAAYNVGFQHLEDARILAQQHGDDPDRWQNVRQYLPLLSDSEWHEKTRYGYARGHEPVRYVRRIRVYQDILRWVNHEKTSSQSYRKPLQALLINVPAL